MAEFKPQTISTGSIQDNVSKPTGFHIHNGVDSPKVNMPLSNFFIKRVQRGITAATGSTQATGTRIIADLVEISVCANAGDSVTLPPAMEGMEIIITNHGAQSCDIFPNLGDKINEGTVDVAKALAADATALCYAYDNTNWEFLTLAR